MGSISVGFNVLRQILAILIQPAYSGSARESTSRVGGATLEKAMGRIWVSAGVPSAGTGVAAGDLCLDTTNDDVYRYYDSAWDKLNITT